MSEYWISKKKYFCKYCEIYIADDAPSRQHHENGLRHQGNRERYIRGIYKDGENKGKEREEEKREMRRVELAAQAAYSQDIGAGLAKASGSTLVQKPAPQTSKTKFSKPSNPFTNYSSPASLGYVDPDVENAAAEAALRQSQGVAGEWHVVESKTTPLKRAADDQQPPDYDDDARSFKLRKKTLRSGLGEVYDPGVISLKPKPKPQQNVQEVVKKEEEEDKPKWSTVKWKRATETASSLAEPANNDNDTTRKPEFKSELSESSTTTETEEKGKDEVIKPPPSTSPTPGLFRKRKVASGSGSRVKTET
ncbi:hypothetical protein F5876DRAFT_50353 [Lentinula aff. lateritia]|uniref:Uncharacterized protein n=1 Tax=Lentinula aff. lateritia TaxID=2804960 RepID=A0ACC1TNC7_9AGAR|nr:hypothetical protein F5876DRAFT_50353 [Lentinula aff. lateritia]